MTRLIGGRVVIRQSRCGQKFAGSAFLFSVLGDLLGDNLTLSADNGATDGAYAVAQTPADCRCRVLPLITVAYVLYARRDQTAGRSRHQRAQFAALFGFFGDGLRNDFILADYHLTFIVGHFRRGLLADREILLLVD